MGSGKKSEFLYLVLIIFILFYFSNFEHSKGQPKNPKKIKKHKKITLTKIYFHVFRNFIYCNCCGTKI